jgi:outer membrane protein W
MLALMITLLLTATPPVAAQDKPFAIRFGLVMLDPTSSSTIMGQKNELDQAFGGEFDFEWYFIDKLGLEASIATVADADIETDSNGSSGAGIAVTPITVGLNWHPVRNESVDWYIGVMAGRIIFGDFEFDDDSASVSTDDDSTYGAQTALDIGIGESWAVNIGLKYLDATVKTAGNQEIAVDPLMVRVMGVFRW